MINHASWNHEARDEARARDRAPQTARSDSADQRLACAELESPIMLQRLFKLAFPGKFLNMTFFGLECRSCISSLERANQKLS